MLSTTNPFVFGPGADNVNSEVLTLALYDCEPGARARRTRREVHPG